MFAVSHWKQESRILRSFISALHTILNFDLIISLTSLLDSNSETELRIQIDHYLTKQWKKKRH